MLRLTLRALTAAQRQGVDPYDAHAAQSSRWVRAWADRARRDLERHARDQERGYNPYHHPATV